MSIGWLSFVQKLFTTSQDRPSAAVIHTLRPTTHHQHHDGITPFMQQTITTSASEFSTTASHQTQTQLTRASPRAAIIAYAVCEEVKHSAAMTCLDIQRDDNQGEALCVYGAADGAVCLYDQLMHRNLQRISHSAVSDVAVVQTSPLPSFQQPSSSFPLFISASSDAVAVHQYDAQSLLYSPHAVSTPPLPPASLTSLSLHPSSLLFAVSGSASFSVVDLHNLRARATATLPPSSPSSSSSSSFTPLSVFHPAGQLLSVSSASGLLLYDLLLPLTSPCLYCPSTSSPVTSCAFHPYNPHALVLGSEDGSLRVLDLRSLRGEQQEAAAPLDYRQAEALTVTCKASDTAQLSSLSFDDSGQHLFVSAGSEIVMYDVADYAVIGCWSQPPAADVRRLRVGRNARWFSTASSDGLLRFYGPQKK